MERVHAVHHPVARDLGDDRGGGDRGALRVAVDDCAVRRGQWAEPEAVDEAGAVRRGRCRRAPIRSPQRFERCRPSASIAERGDRPAPRRATPQARTALEEPLALLGIDLLRVVQRRERPHGVAAEALVVEEHPRDDERAGEAAAPRLVRARDEAHAEPAVESEELLADGSACRRG